MITIDDRELEALIAEAAAEAGVTREHFVREAVLERLGDRRFLGSLGQMTGKNEGA